MSTEKDLIIGVDICRGEKNLVFSPASVKSISVVKLTVGSTNVLFAPSVKFISIVRLTVRSTNGVLSASNRIFLEVEGDFKMLTKHKLFVNEKKFKRTKNLEILKKFDFLFKKITLFLNLRFYN